MSISITSSAGGWQPIKSKKKFDKPDVKQHEKQLEANGLGNSSISTATFVRDYKTFTNIIKKCG
jgi:hypothetical protein